MENFAKKVIDIQTGPGPPFKLGPLNLAALAKIYLGTF